MAINTLKLKEYLSWICSAPFISPEILQIDLTHRCNLDCKMCNVNQYRTDQKDELSSREIIGLLDQARAMGVDKLVLAGGEPLLRKDIFDICAHAKHIGIYPIIVSNGVLLNDNSLVEDMVSKFIGAISVSLDGKEKNHDYLRGAGSYEKTISGIRKLQDRQKKQGTKNISVTVGFVVTKFNYKDVFSVMKQAGKLQVDEVNLLPLMRDNTNLRDTNSTNSLWFSDAEIEDLSEVLKQARKQARQDNVCLAEKIADELMIKYYRGQISSCHWMCYGGFKNIFITLCNPEQKQNFQPYLRICMGFVGNVRKKKLKEIWRSKEAFKARRNVKYCNNPCLQSCFPGVVPSSQQMMLNNILKFCGL